MGLIVTITHTDKQGYVVCEGIQGIFASFFWPLVSLSEINTYISDDIHHPVHLTGRWMIGGDHPSPDSFRSCKHSLSCSVCSYQAIRAEMSLRHWAIQETHCHAGKVKDLQKTGAQGESVIINQSSDYAQAQLWVIASQTFVHNCCMSMKVFEVLLIISVKMKYDILLMKPL